MGFKWIFRYFRLWRTLRVNYRWNILEIDQDNMRTKLNWCCRVPWALAQICCTLPNSKREKSRDPNHTSKQKPMQIQSREPPQRAIAVFWVFFARSRSQFRFRPKLKNLVSVDLYRSTASRAALRSTTNRTLRVSPSKADDIRSIKLANLCGHRLAARENRPI